MWECPKCGRSFKRNGQSHYSGTAPKSIEEYISFQNKEIQPFLMSLTTVLRKAIGEYEEKEKRWLSSILRAPRRGSYQGPCQVGS